MKILNKISIILASAMLISTQLYADDTIKQTQATQTSQLSVNDAQAKIAAATAATEALEQIINTAAQEIIKIVQEKNIIYQSIADNIITKENAQSIIDQYNTNIKQIT